MGCATRRMWQHCGLGWVRSSQPACGDSLSAEPARSVLEETIRADRPERPDGPRGVRESDDLNSGLACRTLPRG